MKRVLIGAGAAFIMLLLVVGTVVFGAGDPSQAAQCTSTSTQDASTHVAVDGYSGDQLTNAAAIINAGDALKVPTYGVVIGVMTAMGESQLRALDYGDKAGPDSRGLFQQRASWGTLAQRMNATSSATLFFTHLLAVPGWQNMTPTEAAHAVQINADPNYYTPYFTPAEAVVSALATGQTCTGGTTATNVVWSGGAGFAPDKEAVNTALAFAEAQLGDAYVIGGAGPNVWDCSGLTMVAYQHAGINIGTHSVADQYATMQAEHRLLPIVDAEPGDLLFWHEADGAWAHVGFYLGGGKMLSAAAPGEGVKEQSVWTSDNGETLAPVVGRPTGIPTS
ncbi:C40 family peptidase [Gryllotalpicola reticulitermitis]|uniref:C40 family peptidase n=1 Tax=Gryllotalpicola reticulitermitis TaxID=1184153 RepID=A0ABV8QBL6_9MICO